MQRLFRKHRQVGFRDARFLVHRCLDAPYQDIRGRDVVLAGEVLSRSNRDVDVEAKRARYAGAGIPFYWELTLDPDAPRISMVRAFALETGHGRLPEGVKPLRESNYVLAAEWAPGADIDTAHPFAIRISWPRLAI